MRAKKMLKLSEQAVGSVMVAMSNSLIGVANGVDENIDISKVLTGYQFYVDDNGTLSVKNPVVPFDIEDRDCSCECGCDSDGGGC